jgi:hypothetical protein
MDLHGFSFFDGMYEDLSIFLSISVSISVYYMQYIYTHIIYTYIYMYTGAIKSTSVSRFIVLADRFLLWVINSSPQ